MDSGGGYHISEKLVIWSLSGVFWILQTSVMEFFIGIVNGFQLLNIRQGLKYISAMHGDFIIPDQDLAFL